MLFRRQVRRNSFLRKQVLGTLFTLSNTFTTPYLFYLEYFWSLLLSYCSFQINALTSKTFVSSINSISIIFDTPFSNQRVHYFPIKDIKENNKM